MLALGPFIVVGEPTAGVDQAPFDAWMPAFVVLGTLGVGCVLLALRRAATPRAVLLAIGTAVAYGFVAAMMIGVVDLLDEGVLALLTNFETYGLVVALVVGTWLQQVAFQAGALGASLPIVTVGEPVIAAALGIAVLGEFIKADGLEWAFLAAVVLLMVVATVALARCGCPLRRVRRGAAAAGRTRTAVANATGIALGTVRPGRGCPRRGADRRGSGPIIPRQVQPLPRSDSHEPTQAIGAL